MSYISNIFNGRRWFRNLLIVVLILLTVGGIVGGVIALSRNTDKIDDALTYKSIGWTKYGIGGLDSNGNYMSTDKSIYTKNAFECQGLNVTPDFDSQVSYQIYFYDQNNEFVHTTGRLTGAFVQDSVPFFAKYARIVITPNDDDKVTIFEKRGYAKQLNVTVYREQGFKNYTENLLEKAKSGYKFDYNTGLDVEESLMDLSNYIKVSDYNQTLIFRDDADAGLRVAAFYDSSKSYLNSGTVGSLASICFTTSTGVKYYSINLSDISDSVTYMRLCWDNAKSAPEVYCR